MAPIPPTALPTEQSRLLLRAAPGDRERSVQVPGLQGAARRRGHPKVSATLPSGVSAARRRGPRAKCQWGARVPEAEQVLAGAGKTPNRLHPGAEGNQDPATHPKGWVRSAHAQGTRDPQGRQTPTPEGGAILQSLWLSTPSQRILGVFPRSRAE